MNDDAMPGKFRFFWQLSRGSDSAEFPSKCARKLDGLLQSERVYTAISPVTAALPKANISLAGVFFFQ